MIKVTDIEERIEREPFMVLSEPVCKRRVTLRLSLEEASKYANQADFALKIENALNSELVPLRGASIQTIHINEEKKIVVVVFDNGTKQIVKCSPEDSFDTEIGFALAFTRAIFGSKTQVRKLIAKKAKVVKKEVEPEAKPKKTRKSKKPIGGK